VLISPLIAAACKTLPQRVISGTSLTAVCAGRRFWRSTRLLTSTMADYRTLQVTDVHTSTHLNT
jgi:hypothetical protein